ncbi:MAG TPA: sulfite exporter TauE/SafE family protein [Chloroflexi bacterium]|nr:sulfite exporter TauE/SafE family protein [Chloroflexota bacterium]
MPPTETGIILLAGLIIFSGHFVKGVSGFGSALFAVPLLMLILDAKFVIPVFLIFDFMSGAILVIANWRSIHRQLLLLLLCGLLVGTSIGTWMLLSFGHELLKRILGVLIIGWSVVNIVQVGEKTRSNPAAGDNPNKLYWAPFSGFLGGALGAMFSVNGPPIIIYLSGVIERKQIFRATLYGIFFADACYKMVLFTANHLLNTQVLRFALLMAPFLVAGTFAGSWLQEFINQEVFKKLVAFILLVTGVILLL